MVVVVTAGWKLVGGSPEEDKEWGKQISLASVFFVCLFFWGGSVATETASASDIINQSIVCFFDFFFFVFSKIYLPPCCEGDAAAKPALWKSAERRIFLLCL